MNPNIFPNANRVNFVNSNISVNVYADDLKKRLKPSKIANHKHHLEGENLRRTVCTEGTRVRILDDILSWAFDSAPDSATLYWLSGPAGSGKTTIAYTIARYLETNHGPNRRKVVGGNFFCSRQFPETKFASRILPTIVYHLALACNAFADALNRCGDFDTVDQDVKSQLEGLLIRPWVESEPSRLADPSTPPYYTIIIDALDEIEGTGGSEFLRALLDTIEGQHLRGLKILATSRPDPALVDRIDSFSDRHLYRLESVPRDEARNDIRNYLGANLQDLRVEVVEKLVNLADGLFIYATTILKYLDGYESLEQEELLDNIFSTTESGKSPTTPDFETPLLDDLYRRILDDAFRGLQPIMRERRLRILHTFLCTAERTSAPVVAHLLADSPNQTDSYTKIVNGVLGRLHPVLYSDGGNILWYHKSFPDFIFAQARSQGFWCNQSALHRRLTDSCFRVMKHGLRFNIADIPSSSALDSDNSTLLDKFRQDIPRVLVYACHQWSHHLSPTTSTTPDPLVGTLQEFLQLRVLFWIEAMNLLLSRGLCDPMLRMAGEWVRRVNAGVASRFYDAASFAVYFSGSQASLSTPQLYISALATTSLPVDHWKSYFPRIPQFTEDSRQAQAGLLMTIQAGGKVEAVAVSRDGTSIVCGSSSGLVKVWSATTGEELMKLDGHTDSATSVAFSSDGTRIVSGSYDKSLRVWNARTGEEVTKLDGHTDSVTSSAFSNDGTRFVSGSWNGSVRVWNMDTGEELAKLVGHTVSVTSVAFSSDGTCIVSGSSDTSVRVWNVNTSAQLAKLDGHSSVTSVAFSNDGTRIASGSDDYSVRVWNMNTGEELSKQDGHVRSVTSVAFSNDGTRIVSGSHDTSVRVWNATTGAELAKLEGHSDLVTSVAFSNDDSRIVSGSWDGSVRVWNAKTGEESSKQDRQTNYATLVSFSNDGTRIVSCSDKGTVRVWNMNTGEELAKLDGHSDWGTSFAFSNDATRVVSGSWDGSVRVWNATTGEQLAKLDGHSSWVISVAFSNDSALIVCGSRDKSVRVWNAKTGEELMTLDGHTSLATSVAFSNDDIRIVSGSWNGTVRVWNIDTGEVLAKLDGHPRSVTSVAFSNDGTRIVSGSWDRSVRVWNATTGAELAKLDGHSDWVTSVAFSSDGTRIVSGSRDTSVRVWHVNTEAQLAKLDGHRDSVTSVAFSNDGTRIVSGYSDGYVRVWNVNTGEELAKLDGHGESASSVAFSNDSAFIVSGSRDKSVRVWNSNTGDGLSHSATSVAFSNDLTRTASGSLHPSIHVRDFQICYIRQQSSVTHYTGWLLSPNDFTRLMFVPPAALLPDSSVILSIPRSASVSLTNACLGPLWANCYHPSGSSSSSSSPEPFCSGFGLSDVS